MEEGLRAHLIADTTLAALVGERIDWAKRRDGAALPAVVLHLVSAPRTNTMTGRDLLVGFLVQIDCWGEDYISAAYVARAVITALDTSPTDAQGVFIENQRATTEPGRDGEVDIYRQSLDVRVWAQDAA